MKKVVYLSITIAVMGALMFFYGGPKTKNLHHSTGVGVLKDKDFRIREQTEPVDFRMLEQAKISGSAQFSKTSLIKILSDIKNAQVDKKPTIVILDLRQEMHLLGDGNLINTICEKDWSEIKHKLDFIIKDENELVQTGAIEREETIAQQLGLEYLRIPVTDDGIPTEKNIDLLLAFYSKQTKNDPDAWFHVHCEHGHGRTTTFMALVHILNTKGKKKLSQILDEQYEKGKIDLSYPPKAKHELKNVELQMMRFAFLEEFHQYINDEESGFYTGKSWSEWKKMVSE